MAITNFIPTVWSENLYTQLDKQYIAVSNSNREFEGDIKEKGSVVKICGVGEVAVSDYTKNTDMSTPQSLSDTVKELMIDPYYEAHPEERPVVYTDDDDIIMHDDVTERERLEEIKRKNGLI